MQTETIIVQRHGLTLSELLARHYRAVIPGAVETVLSLNPGLARSGEVLPLGRSIALPFASELKGRGVSANPVTGLFD